MRSSHSKFRKHEGLALGKEINLIEGATAIVAVTKAMGGITEMEEDERVPSLSPTLKAGAYMPQGD